MKKLMFVVAAVAALGAAAEPVRIIFDTDMICDFDDVGALACLHALADAGECEILATVSSTRGNASVGAIQVINAYYGRAHPPVGAPKGKCVLGAWPGAKEKVDPAAPLGERPAEGDGGHWKYRKLIRDWPEAVTYPDDLSPLDGKALVARKVVRWVAMACSSRRARRSPPTRRSGGGRATARADARRGTGRPSSRRCAASSRTSTSVAARTASSGRRARTSGCRTRRTARTGGIGYATHGWRLARLAERAGCAV